MIMIEIINNFNLVKSFSEIKELSKALDKDVILGSDSELSKKDVNLFLYRIRTNPHANYPDKLETSVLLPKKKTIQVNVFSKEYLESIVTGFKMDLFSEPHSSIGLAMVYSEDIAKENQSNNSEQKNESKQDLKNFYNKKPFKR